jgi:hypothetical protein
VPNPTATNSANASGETGVEEHHIAQVEANQGVHLDRMTLTIPYDPVHLTAQGRFYTIDGLAQASPGRPIQPKTTRPLNTVPGHTPRGIVVLGGQSETDRAFNPIIARPVPTSTLQLQEPRFTARSWFPSKMFAINRHGTTPQLVVIPAQFRGTQTIGQERRFTRIEIAVSYSDSTDNTPPVIWRVETTPGEQTAFRVTASDASGIEQVWVTYSTDGDAWQSIELDHVEYADRWVGSLPDGTERAIYIVQAMDGAGNTAHSANKGLFFGDASENTYLPIVFNKTQP